MKTQRQERLPYLKLNECGPFDVIGDVHGCCDELKQLLENLGYVAGQSLPGEALYHGPVYYHPAGRKAVFLGDLVDRGPCILKTLSLVANMISHQTAFSVMGNHDEKFLRYLKGRNVQIKHGLETTLIELERLPKAAQTKLKQELRLFLGSLMYYYVLDQGKLVVAHAGLKEEMQGKVSDRIQAFALYGETTGEKDVYGLPIRKNWAVRYHGEALVVYGHTPVPHPEWLNNTLNIDTGCVFGGMLTALRYPECELVSVPAKSVYYESKKPFPRAKHTQNSI